MVLESDILAWYMVYGTTPFDTVCIKKIWAGSLAVNNSKNKQ